jgi:hypothetical protein
VTARNDNVPDDERIAAAWRWLTAQLKGAAVPAVIVLVGGGDGDVLDALARHAPGTHVLVLEPDPATARAFLASATWLAWRQGERLAYLAGPDYAGADEAWRIFPSTSGSPPVLLHPQLKPTPAAKQAAQVLKKILLGVASNREARRKFAPRYLANAIRNVPSIARGCDLRDLADVYRGVPAVIAAAGPSLDRALPRLRDIDRRALLIACDTALRPLLASGIAPPLVVGVDPSELNARHFTSLPACANTWLVSESALDRRATQVFEGRTFWYRVSNHEPWPWLNELGIDVGQIDVWGSVLTAAFQVAVLAGCDPIVIVGADLSFPGGRPYARGTTYELDWALETARGARLEDVWQRQIAASPRVTAQDVDGRETETTPALVSFRDWLVARVQRSGRRVINATGAGILVGSGVEQGWIEAALARAIDVPAVAACARPRANAPLRDLATHLHETRAAVASGASTPLLARWAEFSGDGFDAAALGAAIDDALRELDGRAAAADASIDAASSSTASSRLSTEIVSQLPESLARLRTAMNGVPAPASGAGADGIEPTTADRERWLRDAAALLSHVREELALAGDRPIVRRTKATEPATAVYDWPETLRWRVETIEALLGRAWRDGDASLATSFFARAVQPRDDRDGRNATGDASPDATSRSYTPRAYVSLIREWLECWWRLDADDEIRDPLARLLGLEAASRATSEVARATADADVSIRVTRGDDATAVELSLPIAESALGRVMTGVVRAQAGGRMELPSIATPKISVSIRVRPLDGASLGEVGEARGARPLFVARPRQILHARFPRWTIAYAVDRGVICVPVNGTETVIVDEGGRVTPHRRWPRPILSELPFGDEGAVGWANGRSITPAGAPYVMYRRTAHDEPTIEDLPFNPSWGTWWNGRVYWGFLSSDVRRERGLGSWAPGDARVELTADLTCFDLRPSDAGLLLEPSMLGPKTSYERRLLTEGWLWHPARGLEPRALGRYGASGSRSAGAGWIATTYPEADLVTLEADDGTRVFLTAYYPFRAVWAGRSLLVGTVDEQILIFERLADELERAMPFGGPDLQVRPR